MIRERSLDNDLQQKVETMTDEAGFGRLLTFTEHICLETPFERPVDSSALSPEASIVRRFGLRGLRAALEIELGAESNKPQPEDTEEMAMRMDTPIRYPDSFGGPFSHENAAQIEAFGRALVHEAYAVLGDGTDEHLERFSHAASDEDQIRELEWLDGRIREIASDSHDIIDHTVTEYNYHPARLSPKLMGQYPNIPSRPHVWECHC